MKECRENVCCLPSLNGHLLVCLPHFGLRPVRLDRLCSYPFQSRQRQQNISLGFAHKAGLFFAKILNCGGQQRSLFSLSWTQSIAKETNKLVSAAPRLSGGVNWRIGKDRQPTAHLLQQEICKDRIADHTISYETILSPAKWMSIFYTHIYESIGNRFTVSTKIF